MLGNSTIKSNRKTDFYHINVHGIEPVSICYSESDYLHILSIFKKSVLEAKKVEILAYTIEPTFVDILVNQVKNNGISEFIDSFVGEYNTYYSKKYGLSGLLSNNNCIRSKVDNDHLLDTSCTIYLRNKEWLDHSFSSIRAYLYDDVPNWLTKKYISNIYGSAVKYLDFLQKHQ